MEHKLNTTRLWSFGIHILFFFHLLAIWFLFCSGASFGWLKTKVIKKVNISYNAYALGEIENVYRFLFSGHLYPSCARQNTRIISNNSTVWWFICENVDYDLCSGKNLKFNVYTENLCTSIIIMFFCYLKHHINILIFFLLKYLNINI